MSQRKQKALNSCESSYDEIASFVREANQELFLRNALELSLSTLDRERRRVRATLTTEDPVQVYDWRMREMVEEVLLVDAAAFESQTPLLRDHSQWSVRSILGSVLDVSVDGDELTGTLEFGFNLDEDTESIWRRVEQGHLRRGSIGYDYTQKDYETIPAGETRLVRGRFFTAGKDRALRVVTKWRLREYSMVVIPADARATLKNQGMQNQGTQGTDSGAAENSRLNTQSLPVAGQTSEDTMKKFLQFLHRHGLATSVTSEAEALDWARNGNLSSDLLAELATLCEADGVKFDVTSARARDSATTGTRSGTTTGSATNDQPLEGGTGGASQRSTSSAAVSNPDTLAAANAAAQAAVTAERQRVAAIHDLHRQHSQVVNISLAQRAVSEGWDLDRTRTEFLNCMVGSREQGAPAIHVRGSHQLTRRVLQAALLEREGIRPESNVWRSDPALALVSRRRELDLGWAINPPESGARRDEMEQAFDVASQQGLRGASLMRIAELCAELTNPGVRYFSDDEIMERAFSSGDFSAVFGAVVHMQLLAAYSRSPAVYREFAEVREVGDFRTHSTADMAHVSRLKKMGKNGGEAALLNTEDQTLTSLLIERFAGTLIVDDQTLINDSFGVTGMLPTEVGEMCMGMADDIAMAEVLATGNLSDSLARYNNTTGNQFSTAAITETAITTLGSKLKAQKIGKRRIDVRGMVVVAGTLHAPTLRRWAASEFVADDMKNPHYGTFRVAEDTAIDLGVNDPRINDAAVSGTPTAAYAFSTGTKRSVVVAFRRGTGQGPVTRPPISLDATTTDRWGLAWKVYMDMGAAFQRRIGTVKMTVTG